MNRFLSSFFFFVESISSVIKSYQNPHQILIYCRARDEINHAKIAHSLKVKNDMAIDVAQPYQVQ